VSHHFSYAVDAAGTELRMIDVRGRISVNAWAIEAPTALVRGVDIVQRLIATGDAIADDDFALIDHKAVASLNSSDAASLGFPPLADAVARIEGRGIVTAPNFGVDLRWQRQTGQPIVGARRVGAWLRIGSNWYRLSDVLFDIAESVDKLNAVVTGPHRLVRREC
jgi:hypothetical protein